MTIWLLLTFLVAVLFVAVYFAWDGGVVSLGFAAVSFATYIYVRQKDSRYNEEAERNTKILSVYQKESSYLDEDFSCFASGEQYTLIPQLYPLTLFISS